MAAGVALLQTLPPGTHVLFPDDLYYGFRIAAAGAPPRWGITATSCAMARPRGAASGAAPGDRLVWLETPVEPADEGGRPRRRCAELARGAGALTLVDNTFATPALQRPLALGADVVLHSTTKYFGGHSDVQGGALVFARRDDLVRAGRPPAAHPGRRGLALQLLAGAARPAHPGLPGGARRAPTPWRWRGRSPGTRRSRPSTTPGSPSHPGHEVARRQMRAFGGMLSFQRARRARARRCAVASRCGSSLRATSLGGVESLIEHRASSEGPGSHDAAGPAAPLDRPGAPGRPGGRPPPSARLEPSMKREEETPMRAKTWIPLLAVPVLLAVALSEVQGQPPAAPDSEAQPHLPGLPDRSGAAQAARPQPRRSSASGATSSTPRAAATTATPTRRTRRAATPSSASRSRSTPRATSPAAPLRPLHLGQHHAGRERPPARPDLRRSSAHHPHRPRPRPAPAARAAPPGHALAGLQPHDRARPARRLRVPALDPVDRERQLG